MIPRGSRHLEVYGNAMQNVETVLLGDYDSEHRLGPPDDDRIAISGLRAWRCPPASAEGSEQAVTRK